MASNALTWDRDGRALIVSVEGENAVVRSTKPSAPGSRPFGILASGSEIRLKVHRCYKNNLGDELVFTIEGRLLDATKTLRKELSSLLGGGGRGAGEIVVGEAKPPQAPED
jgi:hypothetical protein